MSFSGYVAGGDLDYSRRPRPMPPQIMEKSVCVAYLLWLIGGFFGLHLIYLRRDRQVFVWWCTFGGYLGLGVLRDFVRIPAYVRDVNNDRHYMLELMTSMQRKKQPSFSVVRFVGQILVGNSWSFLVSAAVPQEEIFGVSLKFLIHLAPLGAAVAVWLIGNIGREQGDLKWALIGAFMVTPFAFFDATYLNWSSIVATLLFTYKRQWRRTPYTWRSLCSRLMTLWICTALFWSLWFSYLYFNATVTDKQGETIKLRDAAKHFLNSPMFLEFKANMRKLFDDAQLNGWAFAWANLIELLDPLGETHALKVLELQKGVTQEEITSQYRKLSREWHPDRHPDEMKQVAQEKFVEIQQAYEKLSTIKNKRNKRNKISQPVEKD